MLNWLRGLILWVPFSYIPDDFTDSQPKARYKGLL